MYDFFEDIKERAEISVRELILSIACGVLLGFVAGLLLGSRLLDVLNLIIRDGKVQYVK